MLRIIDDVSLAERECWCCSFVRHRWCPPGWRRMGDGSSLSLCIQWGCNDVEYHHCFPPGWQKMGDGASLSFCIQWGCNDEDHWFPLGCRRMGNGSLISLCTQWGCNDITLVRALVTTSFRLPHWVVMCFTLDPLGWLGLGHYVVQSVPSSRDVVSSNYGQ